MHHWVRKNGAIRLTAITWRHTAGSMCSNGDSAPIKPALFTRPSRRPYCLPSRSASER